VKAGGFVLFIGLATIWALAVVVPRFGQPLLSARIDGPPREGPNLLASPEKGGIPEAMTLAADGVKLYSLGQYAEACQRFSDALERDLSNTMLRLNLARCFEGWGWRALRDARPEEARALFRQGLRQDPESGPLLKGMGLSAIHAGQAEEAVEPLEAALRYGPDAEASLLLAKIYDQKDQTDRAITLLRRLLEREPNHPEAAKLVQKLERERLAESGFWKDESRHFIVKYRGARELELRRLVLNLLEEIYDRVGGDLGSYPEEKITIILYPEERFQEATGAHHWANGIFDGKIRLPLASVDGRTRALERLLAHEYTHALVHLATRGRAPRWLHEGLAQYEEGAVVLPGPPAKSEITLAELESLLQDGDLERARQGYQLALLVVRDLIARGGLPALRELLSRLGQGEPEALALSRIYGVPLSELERQWKRAFAG
jgi:tetratricopeptide (TPR) repeat protein